VFLKNRDTFKFANFNPNVVSRERIGRSSQRKSSGAQRSCSNLLIFAPKAKGELTVTPASSTVFKCTADRETRVKQPRHRFRSQQSAPKIPDRYEQVTTSARRSREFFASGIIWGFEANRNNYRNVAKIAKQSFFSPDGPFRYRASLFSLLVPRHGKTKGPRACEHLKIHPHNSTIHNFKDWTTNYNFFG